MLLVCGVEVCVIRGDSLTRMSITDTMQAQFGYDKKIDWDFIPAYINCLIS